jgi:hypothetical protein
VEEEAEATPIEVADGTTTRPQAEQVVWEVEVEWAVEEVEVEVEEVEWAEWVEWEVEVEVEWAVWAE